MGVNSLPKTVTRQRHGCYLNPGPFAPESSTLTTRLPSHPEGDGDIILFHVYAIASSFSPSSCGKQNTFLTLTLLKYFWFVSDEYVDI